MKIYLDGQFVDKEDAKISVFDHGLLYGDGIFEGIRLYRNCVYRLDEHLERLEYSAKAILLDMPWSREELSELVCESCRVNNLSDGYIRLLVTRGPGSLGLSPNSCPKPSLIIIADKIALYPEECYSEGLSIVTVPTRRTNPAALNPGVKSLNYLNNIMAKIEAAQAGALEAIMLNDQGYVAECTGDNLFIVHKGKMYTPDAANGALRGITRQAVIDIAREQGLEVRECNLTRYEIWNADECFLTGTAAELIPVVKLDSRVIGDGAPGKVTKQLHAAFHDEVISHGTML
ncbi:branched-chain-amino-acid transaminase [Pelagicoccus sp. SDUM812003]|uniref:branched-chain-amino-acid transaminase n=1 Tax=Pelagicoccus sp. SDUM812003 TaxID=3041267 RepID=UPI00280DAB46|nr:branched-chain-amino-acid transaminase [Pelagicoccus sp. SDUM812003]MDQ8202119.1 branched-chain-amino-acid transaminase [Pelagicoccus sp. SDUM812003]